MHFTAFLAVTPLGLNTAFFTNLRGYINGALDIGVAVMVFRVASYLIKSAASADDDDDEEEEKAQNKLDRPSKLKLGQPREDRLVLDEEELGFFDARRTYFGDEMDDGRIRLRGFGEHNDDDY